MIMINKNSSEKILFTIVGNKDPYSNDEAGPVLSFIGTLEFSHIYLFCSGPDYFEKAKTLEQEALQILPSAKFSFVDLDIKLVIDYEEIYVKLKSAVKTILNSLPQKNPDISILLDPGTPQMQTCWFLLAKSSFFNACLYQGIPARFAGGNYKYKTVNPDSEALPHVTHDLSQCRKVYNAENEAEIEWINTKLPGIVRGKSAVYNDVFVKAEKISGYDISVLILGETGTGKGVFAKLIHECSNRCGKPFMPVNCSGISITLAESELFGHVKGAFTGADRNRLGQFRAADGGTVFLDEIGDLPLEIQPKLLRVLEEKVVSPVGDEKEYKVDLRIIAATNRNPEQLIKEGLFRRDLYERLNQISITIPPLRDHREDIPEIVQFFLDKWNSRYSESKALDNDALEMLRDFPWPGNIRQLSNTITTACASSVTADVTFEYFPEEILSYFNKSGISRSLEITIPEGGINLKSVIYNFEKAAFIKALEKTAGNRESAAKLLGINPPAFRKALRERFNIADD